MFITGGNSQYPNFVERVETDLRCLRPFKSTFKVWQAEDPMLDGWRGGASWASGHCKHILLCDEARVCREGCAIPQGTSRLKHSASTLAVIYLLSYGVVSTGLKVLAFILHMHIYFPYDHTQVYPKKGGGGAWALKMPPS